MISINWLEWRQWRIYEELRQFATKQSPPSKTRRGKTVTAIQDKEGRMSETMRRGGSWIIMTAENRGVGKNI